MLALGQAIRFHSYGDPLVTAGDYAYLSFVSSDYRYKVSRVNTLTGENVTVDLGALPENDLHYYQVLAVDPTDNKLVVITAGRYMASGDYRPSIRKSVYAFGGTDEQFAEFTDPAYLVYPPNGLLGYCTTVMGADGSLYIFGRKIPSRDNPAYNNESRGLTMYRYVGDGTAKTPAQMATGTYTDIVQQTGDQDGRIYGTSAVMRDGRLGVLLQYQEATIDGWNTSPRRGAGYLYTDNPTATTPVWRRVDGVAQSVPVSTSQLQKDTVLFAHNLYGDYFGTLDIVAGSPVIAAPRFSLDGSWNITSRWLERYRWNGTAWEMDTITSPADGVGQFGHSYGGNIYHSPSTALGTIKTDPDGDSTQLATQRLTTVRVADSDNGLVYAGISLGQLLFGPTPSAEGDYDVILAQASPFDFDVALPEPPASGGWYPVFSDDFNRDNSQVVGNGWSQSPSPASGSSGIYANTLWNIDQSNPMHLSRPQSFGNTLAIEADILNRGNGFSMGFSSEVGGTGWGNGYVLRYANIGGQERVVLNVMNSGVLGTTVGSYTFPSQFTGNIRLERSQAGDFTLFVDGNQVQWIQGWSVNDTTYMTPADPATYGLRMLLNANSTNTICRVDNFACEYKIPEGTGYTLTYSANGGQGAPQPQFGAETYTVTAGAPTRTGYDFVSWNTLPDGAGTGYNPSDTITLTAPTTLYAIWAVKAPEPIWCDNFNRANSSTVGNGWVQQSSVGSGGILSNRVYLSHTVNTQWYWVRNEIADAGALSALFPADSGSSANARMFLYFTDRATTGTFPGPAGVNGYYAEFRGNGDVLLRTVINRTTTIVAQQNFGDVRGSICGFKADGSELTAYLDGVPVLTATTAQPAYRFPAFSLYATADNPSYIDDLCVWGTDYPPPQPPTGGRRRRQRVIQGGY